MEKAPFVLETISTHLLLPRDFPALTTLRTQIFSATKIPENAFFLVRRNLDLFRDEEREGIKHPLDLWASEYYLPFSNPRFPPSHVQLACFYVDEFRSLRVFPVWLFPLLLSDECCGQKSVGTRVHRRFFFVFTHASHMVHDIWSVWRSKPSTLW